MLIEEFNKFISEKRLANKTDKILLAVSGGADSVVMLDLFAKSGFDISIAHCNFLLRGKNSDKDEKFVTKLAFEYDIKIFTKTCTTKSFSKENKISIEMAARQLRYEWFEDLVEKQNFTKIATAHHLNDTVETILLNLSKKTGIKGLTGIPISNRKIIRPLLFASKDRILHYCTENNLSFRTDESNLQNKYQRNKIRNQIIPRFEEISPAFVENVAQTAEYLQQYVDFFKTRMKKFKDLCVFYKDYSVRINTKKMFEYQPIKLFLYEFLKEYDFNSSQVNDILVSINSVGKQFFANKNRLIIDREEIIITNIKSEQRKSNFSINYNDYDIVIHDKQVDALHISMKIYNREDINLKKNQNFAFLDFDKIKYPLLIRKWEVGDFFIPFGMNSKKKLSNFFSDNKFSLIDKENTWLLTSENKIIWVIGHRIDNRFRISDKTQKVIVFEKLEK